MKDYNPDEILNQPMPTEDYEVFWIEEKFGIKDKIQGYKFRVVWFKHEYKGRIVRDWTELILN